MPEVSEDLNCPILHVDATSLSQVRLTGVGRCVARIIESLARRQTIALFSMVTRDDLRVMRQIETLHGGLVIHLGPHNVPEPGLDITTWRDRVLALPTQPFDASLAARSGGVYTFRRSRKKRFAREVSVYYDLTALLTPQTHKGQTRRDFSNWPPAWLRWTTTPWPSQGAPCATWSGCAACPRSGSTGPIWALASACTATLR